MLSVGLYGDRGSHDLVAIDIDSPTTRESREIFLLSMPGKMEQRYIHIYESNINTNKNSDTEDRKNLFESKEAVSNSDRFETFQFIIRKKRKKKKKKGKKRGESISQDCGKNPDIKIIKVQQTVHKASVKIGQISRGNA